MIFKDGNELLDWNDSKANTAEDKPGYNIDKILEILKKYHADRHTVREIVGLYNYLYQLKYGLTIDHGIHNGIFLRTDNDALALDMIQELDLILYRQGILDRKALVQKEDPDSWKADQLPSGNLTYFYVVHNCQQLPVVDNLMSLTRQDNLQKKINHWINLWEGLDEFCRKNPHVIPVVLVDPTVENNTWKKYDHFYYRLFNRHITVRDFPVEDIQSAVHDKISSLGFMEDSAFTREINRYIEVVYQKADLKGDQFVEDLINRILVAFYNEFEPAQILTERTVPHYRKPRSVEDILHQLDKMVGMDGVKTAFEEIYYQSSEDTRNTPNRMHMAFVGNPGTGKTTVAGLAADLLYQMGIIKKKKLVSAKPSDLISPFIGQTAIQTRKICQDAYDGILFIDEAYALGNFMGHSPSGNDGGRQCIDMLLQEMEENADRLVVIFAGYPEPINELLNSNSGLRSRVNRTILFRDFTEDELVKIFAMNAQKNGYTIAEDAHEALHQRMMYEKSSENFGNARSVENVFQNVLGNYRRSPNDNKQITREHILATMPEKHFSNLKSMIGLDEIKEQLNQFESRVQYIHTVQEKGLRVPPMNMHMLFTGNPGTGKTTVARAIADDLFKIGILTTNKCISIAAKDLVSDWSSAIANMDKYIRQAIGGILFIDEAYALTEYASRGIGSEIITVLLTAMEEHKNDLIVIFSGYEKNMLQFLTVNPGLSSRIGHTFQFKDYTTDELCEIFVAKMKSYGYILTERVPPCIKSVMSYFREMPEFGNGRFVDSLIDQTITKRSLRGLDSIFMFNEIDEMDIPTIKEVLGRMPAGSYYRNPSEITLEEKKRTAIHEIGHAIISVILRPEIYLTDISIHSQALSNGRISWQTQGNNLTEKQLYALLATLLGGRAAERLIFDTHSTGCSSDFQSAKAIASDMLEKYGMGDQLGSRDITPILARADAAAAEVLGNRKDLLLRLADDLLTQNELTDEFVRKAVNCEDS